MYTFFFYTNAVNTSLDTNIKLLLLETTLIMDGGGDVSINACDDRVVDIINNVRR